MQKGATMGNRRVNTKVSHKTNAVLRCSLSSGVRTVGFRDSETGLFHAVMNVQTPLDIDRFMEDYDVSVLSMRYVS